MGLRLRLVLLLLVPMILVVAGYAYVRWQEEREQRRTEFDQRVHVTSTAIRLAVEHGLRTDTLADVKRLAADLVVKQTEIVRIRLLDANLRTRLDSNLLAGDPGVPLDRHRQVRDTGQPAVVPYRSADIRLHAVILPVRPSGADDGVLEVAYVAGRLEADLLRENYREPAERGRPRRPAGPGRRARAPAARVPPGRRPDAGHRAGLGGGAPGDGACPERATSWGRWRWRSTA